MPNDEQANLSREKLAEEIQVLRLQRRNDRVRLWLDYAKAAAIAVAAIITFIILQRPESLLNRTASKESIARERAKLLLESLKEPDASKRLDSLMIIRVAYGSDDAAWLDAMEKVLKEKVERERMLNQLSQIEQLRKRRSMLHEQLVMEAAGTGPSHHPGEGYVYQQLRKEIEVLDVEIDRLTSELRSDRATK